MLPQKEKLHKNAGIWLLLAAALLVRLFLVLATEGYEYDLNCFFAWALKMADEGPALFYSEGYFADYPPGYMLVLGVVGRLMRVFDAPYTGKLARVFLTAVPVLADCALTALVYHIGCRSGRRATALRVAAFTAFCPVLLFDTAVWKQIDGVLALAVVACFYLLDRKKYLPAALLYGVALAVKPQALLAGPVLALCFLLPLLQSGPAKQRLRALGRGAAGALLALAVPVLCGLPFWGADVLGALWQKYTTTSQSYPYASINAFDLQALLGGNWAEQTTRFGPLSYQQWGTLWLVLLTVAVAALGVYAARRGRFCPLLLAAFYTVGVFTLAHRMHERYLIMALLLLLAAAAKWADRRLLALGFGFSIVGLFNLAAVYCQVGTDDEWLSSATSQSFIAICSAAQVVLFVLLAVTVFRLLVRGQRAELCLPPAETVPQPGPAQPAWTRGEALFLALLTAVVAAVSLYDLGDMTAPQTVLDTVDGPTQTVTAAVQPGQPLPQTLWVYCGVNDGGTLHVTANDTGEQYTLTADYGSVYTWQTLAVAPSQSYTFVVENMRIVELSLRAEDGAAVAVTDESGSALFDEAELVPQVLSHRNNTHFDEIYHARTGYETLHGMTIYETTHPPLGKDFIMLGIAIFGMTGFGWRISGTVFGILLIPLLYLLARRLTRRPTLAAVAGILFGADFMRFAQSRIATIDVYATFFILLSAYFMLWYCQSVLEKGVDKSILPMALCGLAFGLGCASKWTGLYAGAGLAVLYFLVLYARFLQRQPGFGRELALALGGGVVFFVVLPVAIYLASYLPYLWHDPTFDLHDWWDCQTYMYWYHSTLEASHPFESRWYTWLFDLRPVWYYQNRYLAEGLYASIAGFGNPLVWWSGTAAVLGMGCARLCGQGDRRWNAVLVLYLTQLLPWVLVTRCTFMYHYFPSVGFSILAAVLCLQWLQERAPSSARRVGVALCAAAVALFVLFYPVLAGVPVSGAVANALKALPGWGFYIVS